MSRILSSSFYRLDSVRQGVYGSSGLSCGRIMTRPKSWRFNQSIHRFTGAEIRDEGIDLNLALDQNWKKQIAGANGSIIRYLKPGENGLAESFDHDNITFKEVIADLHENNGAELTAINADMELISDPIQIGDVLTVRRCDETFPIRITDIAETADDNLDAYTMDIKF